MRYAMYFMPRPDTPLWSFGCSILAYDAATGLDAPFVDEPLLISEGGAALSAEPRRYGFHATLKAPFALVEGAGEAELLAAAAAFAAGQRAIQLELKVAQLTRFVALVPIGDSSQINRLAADCVRAFEPLRAPLTEADRQRRLAAPLNDRQIANLERWGYPYVFEEFRFHMTLLGPLPSGRASRIASVLHRRYDAIRQPAAIDAVTVARQGSQSERFIVLRRFEFANPLVPHLTKCA